MEYFTPEEAAKKLKIARRTIYHWLRQGKIKGTKLGNMWRISETELNRILGENGENKK
ncbi:MAG: helix-turn-helix domain-containing protein [Peptococcaceae bacterium]|jgi:acetyl-CoA synthetase|nr:helix-turn-helix domain-containing protein [Peptococcaceae bacterium]